MQIHHAVFYIGALIQTSARMQTVPLYADIRLLPVFPCIRHTQRGTFAKYRSEYLNTNRKSFVGNNINFEGPEVKKARAKGEPKCTMNMPVGEDVASELQLVSAIVARRNELYKMIDSLDSAFRVVKHGHMFHCVCSGSFPTMRHLQHHVSTHGITMQMQMAHVFDHKM